MNEFRDVLIAGWIAMFLVFPISIISGIDIISLNAVIFGNIVFVLTMIYIAYGWYLEYKAEHPKLRR